MYALRWIFLIILIYVIVSMFILAFTQGLGFLSQIVTLSIGGFFGFFMGYFGWMFAHQLMKWINGRE